MGASVRAEDSMFDDPRFDVLGGLLGITGDDARFKMMRIWKYCTQLGDVELDVREAELAFRVNGCAESMIRARLAEPRDNGKLYFRGTLGRVEWLNNLRKAGKKGVVARHKKRQARLNQGLTVETKPGSTKVPPLTIPIPIPILIPTEERESAVASDRRARSERHSGEPGSDNGAESTSGYRDFIARFSALYEATRGCKPEWGAKQGAGVKRLLAKPGGLQDAMARSERMFAMAPKFPAENPDLGTLIAHWDKFAPSPAADVSAGGHKLTDQFAYAGGEVDL